MRFSDRREAGRVLADALQAHGAGRPLVLGLPRGGVVVAAEVARALGAGLDVVVARKLGAPGRAELAMGAIAEGGVAVFNERVLAELGVAQQQVEATVARETTELQRRAALYRSGRPSAAVAGRTVILVDDGLATGATARAAARALRAGGAGRIVLAVPVGAPDTVAALRAEVDEVVCPEQPPRLYAIGGWYTDFGQVTDEEVLQLLETGRAGPPVRRSVAIEVQGVRLDGELAMPRGAVGVVVFAHGSGSSRRSPRNAQVSRALERGGLATVLFDLLTPDEAANRDNVFDIPLLGRRVAEAIGWARRQPETGELPLGVFGASTGAAAALWAAATEPIAAVVSRGGRPDLAGDRLADVTAPTLLIVGGRDEVVLDLNRQAQQSLRCPSALEVIPGATHLFEEPGALEAVSSLASDWFRRCFERARAEAAPAR